MASARTTIVSVVGVDVLRLVDGAETPLATEATVTLSRIAAAADRAGSPETAKRRRTPPPPPPYAGPGRTSPAASASVSSQSGPSAASASSPSQPESARPSSPKARAYMQLSVIAPKDNLNVLDMPVPTPTEGNIVTVAPSSYIIPDPVRTGFIKLVLPSGAKGTVDAETRELFESALFGTGAPESTDGITELQAERNQLYILDEDTGRLIGRLDDGSELKESGSFESDDAAPGRKAPGPTTTTDGRLDEVDQNEAVVIDAMVGTGDAAEGGGTVTYTVQPASAYYNPIQNPNNSKILETANTVSRGLVIGSELLSRQLQRGAGYYISHRPATQTPMQFSETTKGAFEKSSAWTRTATVYSGKAIGAIGDAAAKLGDRIGRKTGVQQTLNNDKAPGWKGAVANTLKGLTVVADHFDASSKAIFDSGSKSASQMIHHTYGGEARDLADHAGSSVKHVALVYIDARGIGRRALVKGVGKGAIKARMADGSQLYLSGSDSELKQLEAAANEEAAAQAVGPAAAAAGDTKAVISTGSAPAAVAASVTSTSAPTATSLAGSVSPGAASKRRTPPPPPPGAGVLAGGPSSSEKVPPVPPRP